MSKPTIASMQAQIDELTKALQRERADVINVRRHHDSQLSGLRDSVKAALVEELLPALDNLERALKHAPADLEGHDYVKGVQGVAAQFDQIFNELGVERIKTVGETFDPMVHEAVSMEEGNGTVEVVCEELQPGYKLGDNVIRHAMVKVKMEAGK